MALIPGQRLHLPGKAGASTARPPYTELAAGDRVLQQQSYLWVPKHLLILYFSTLAQALAYKQMHTTVTSLVLETNVQEQDSLCQVSMK